MVAIHLAFTAPVNPPGSSPHITLTQCWAALKRKAYHGEEFVPVIQKTEVTSISTDEATGETFVFREVYLKDKGGPQWVWSEQQKARGREGVMSEKVVIPATASEQEGFSDGGCALDFYPEDGSHVQNIISVGADGNLFLTFAFAFNHTEVDVSTPDGRSKMEELRKSYIPMSRGAVEKTIASTRDMIRDGRIR